MALSILSVGIVAILHTYLISLNRMRYLTNRFYATMILDDRLALMDRKLRLSHRFPKELDFTENSPGTNFSIQYQTDLKTSEPAGLEKLFKVDLSLNWLEDKRPVHLSRSALLADF